MRDANYWWMLVMFCFLMISHGLRSWRWRYLLEPVKANIGFRNLFSGVMVGYFLNNVLPRAGELARPYTIGKLESIPKSAAFGTIVVERIMDTITFLVLVVAVPLVYNGPLRETFPWLAQTGIIISCITLGMIIIIVALMLRRDWTDVLLNRFARFLSPGLSERIEGFTHSFLDGFLFLKRPRNFFVIFVLSCLIWFMYVLMMYVSFFAFGLGDRLGLGAAIVVQIISSIGVAMPTPGATGTYHVFTSQALIRLFQVSDDVALSFATVTHAVGYIGVTVIGLYYFLQDHIKVSEAIGKIPGHNE